MAARDYILGLHAAGEKITWTPLIFDGRKNQYRPARTEELDAESIDPELLKLANLDLPSDVILIHSVPEYWPLFCETGKRNIGLTVWETDSVPPHWPDLLNGVDDVIVPCRFNREVFRKDGVRKPIHVVPYINNNRPPDFSAVEIRNYREELGIEPDDLVFYTINTWNSRKALGDLIEAYLRAFTSADRVFLVVKTSPEGPRSGEEIVLFPTTILADEIIAGHDNSPPVKLITRNLPRRDLEALQAIGDCYVSLTRGEGWGLGAFDAVARGKPIMITGWGGQVEFLSPDYPYLVDYELVPVIDRIGGYSYRPEQRWARANIDHAAAIMRTIYEDPERARFNMRDYTDRVNREYSSEIITGRLLDVLRRSRMTKR